MTTRKANTASDYRRPTELALQGAEIVELEAAGGDSVRITKTDGSFILISPRLRDVHKPDKDLLIEVFASPKEFARGDA